MKTKNFFFIAVVAALMSGTQMVAQNTTTGNKKVDPAELVNRRCNRMCNAMQLDDATAAKFTPLYTQYLNELRACRTACPTEYRDDNCTDAQRKACIVNRLDNREKMVKVQKKYYKEFEKILNAKQLQTVFCDRHHAGNKHYKAGRHHNNKHHNRRYNCNGNGYGNGNCNSYDNQNCPYNNNK